MGTVLKTICIMTTLALLCACGKDDPAPAVSAEPDEPDERVEALKDELLSETIESDESDDEEVAGRSLADRMAGKYSYHHAGENGEEEFYIMDVVNFGSNLYAFCGQSMPGDYESLEAYTFWATEFIPYDSKEMKSTDGNKVRVNELNFSVMSNAGKYWNSGHTGTIELTNDGLVFEGFDHDGFLVPDNDDSRLFLKDERVGNAFSYLKNTAGDDELQGYWVNDDNDVDLYALFSDSNLYMYRKSRDEEVFFVAGGCDLHNGSFDFRGNLIQNGGMPFEFSADYKVDGDRLSLEIQGPDMPPQVSEKTVFEHVSEKDIHVTTMDEVVFNEDSFGPFGSESSDIDEVGEPYCGVLYWYKQIQDSGRSWDEMEKYNSRTALVQHGWPYSTDNNEVRYVYQDITGDGLDELIVTYYGDPVDIYSNDGDAVYSYGVPYRAIAEIYPDGTIMEGLTMGTKGWKQTWYRYDNDTYKYVPLSETLNPGTSSVTFPEGKRISDVVVPEGIDMID